MGLFRPEDTIAFLGAEKPSASSNGSISIQLISDQNGAKKKKRKKEEKDKNAKLEERRRILEISQPQGDLRHMCHVGADGRSFGLLNVREVIGWKN